MSKTFDIERELIVAESASMRQLMTNVARIAPYHSTVLVEGESGTGKNVIAKAIHLAGAQRNQPFIAVNCAALPETLFESELFGHVRGAFSGAVKDKRGMLDEAQHGTLVLDEIGELSPGPQAKLLRVLQEGTYRKVGATEECRTNARVIVTTSRDLEQAVATGRFREDLFYRLNVLPLRVSPLRERREDILPLVQHFLLAAGIVGGIAALSAENREAIVSYDWPGNVRELQNIVERSIILSGGLIIEVPRTRPDERPDDLLQFEVSEDQLSIKRTLAQLVPEVEAILIRRALKMTGNNRTRAAKLLEISHRSLLYKLKSYNCG